MYSLEGPVHTYSMYLYRYCFIDLYTHHLHIPLSTHQRTHYRTSVHTPVHTLHTPYTNAQLAVHIHSTYSLYCTFLYVLVHKDSYTTPYARIYSIHICIRMHSKLNFTYVCTCSFTSTQPRTHARLPIPPSPRFSVYKCIFTYLDLHAHFPRIKTLRPRCATDRNHPAQNF